MTVCQKCSARNDDPDGFCVACRAYLGYWGRRTQSRASHDPSGPGSGTARMMAPARGPKKSASAPGAPSTPITQDAPRSSHDSSSVRPVPGRPGESNQERADAEVRSRKAALAADALAGGAGLTSAQSLAGRPAPTPGPVGVQAGVGATKPSDNERGPSFDAVPGRSQPRRRPQPYGHRSGQCRLCRQENSPGRHFCETCGDSLESPAPPQTESQVTTLERCRQYFSVRRRSNKVSVADRQLRRQQLVGAGRSFLRAFLALLALTIAVLALGPYRSQASGHFSAFRSRLFPHPVYVQPSSATIGDGGPSAKMLVDLSATTAWTGSASTTFVFGFSPAVKLFKLGVLNGGATTGPGYKAHGRARSVEVMAFDAVGRQIGHRTLTVSDKPGFQQFLVPFSSASKVTVTVIDEWTGTSPTLALRELEFFRRS